MITEEVFDNFLFFLNSQFHYLLRSWNDYLNVTSINIFPKQISGQIPSVGGNEDPVDKEAAAEEEKLRQEAIKEAEEKRRVKHKKLEEERENMRQGIRDRVSFYLFTQLWLSQMVNISIKNIVEFHSASGEIQ